LAVASTFVMGTFSLDGCRDLMKQASFEDSGSVTTPVYDPLGDRPTFYE
jgi:hypothetical protein